MRYEVPTTEAHLLFHRFPYNLAATTRQLTLWGVLISVCIISAGLSSKAEAQVLPLEDFGAIRYELTPGPGNYLMVEGARVGQHLSPSAGAGIGYAHRSYVADDLDCQTGTARGADCAQAENQETALNRSLLVLQLHGSVSLWDRVQIGLNLPVLLYYEGQAYNYVDRSGDPMLRTAAPGGSGAGLGDPRLHLKLRLFGDQEGADRFSLATAGWVTAPVAHLLQPDQFLGDALPRAGGHLIAEFSHGHRQAGAFRLALNLGGQYRAEASNIRSTVGPELTWGAAGALVLVPGIELLLEASGATSFGQNFDSEAPTEARVAGRIRLGELLLHAGGGAGLVYGVGVPVFRVFLGGRWRPSPDLDSDGDGLLDRVDACPTLAEDADGFEDEDGCPDPDNDGDHFPDGADPCPDEPEDVDGFEDEDGCPDPDNDGDGISDGYDTCPSRPEDIDGDRDDDGCPDGDTDQDGLDDGIDQCPDEPEDFDGFADDDGCPEDDVDGDGVDDESDDCPEEPGTASAHGCAPQPISRSSRRRRYVAAR